MKGHVDRMNHREQLDDLLPQIRDKHISDQGNVTQTSGINGGKNTNAGVSDEVTCPLPLEGTTKADVMRSNGGGNCRAVRSHTE
jgi:hypothetical protein